MNNRFSRRRFVQASIGSAAAVGLSGWTAASWARVIGSNEDVRIATVGFNGRGKSHIDAWRKMKGVRLVALCDADEDVLNKMVANLAKPGSSSKKSRRSKENKEEKPPTEAPASIPGIQVKGYQDVRKLLDDKDIDAISVATPNHWHTLMAIWGLQAGKDVYVEKPLSHNIWEGRQLVKAVEKYGDRIAQIGTQSRSSGSLKAAFEWVQAGNLGKILIGRGLCYKHRPNVEGAEKLVPPKGVNYDLWCGPSSLEQLPRKKLHYDWHWYWKTGNGDIGNQGIHEMDKTRWGLGKNELPVRVFSIGGRVGYTDNAQTAATQMCVYDYGDVLQIFEVRGMYSKPGSPNMDKYKKVSIGQVIECEGGWVAGGDAEEGVAAYDKDGKLIKKFGGKGEDHFGNFMKAVRSRNRSELNAPILGGHLSTALCHMGNISYRVGQTMKPEEIKEHIKGNKAAMETYGRMAEHLAANGVDIEKEMLTVGPMLTMDSKTERFTGDHAEEANKLVKDVYRDAFVVPENV